MILLKKGIAFSLLIASLVCYAGGLHQFELVESKLKSSVPEIAFYWDADNFLDDTFFHNTVDVSYSRRKEIFIQLFTRSFGLHVWLFHRQELAEIAGTLYQTILYERETNRCNKNDRGSQRELAIADFDNLESVEVEIIYDEE